MPIFANTNDVNNMSKLFVVNKQLVIPHINAGFPITIQSMIKPLKSTDNVTYNTDIYYIEGAVHITSKFTEIMNTVRSSYARMILHYVVENIEYGTNVIELKPKVLKTLFETDDAKISKAIKELIDLEFMVRGSNIPTCNLKHYQYVINHNCLYKGNIKNLYHDLLQQTEFV